MYELGYITHRELTEAKEGKVRNFKAENILTLIL